MSFNIENLIAKLSVIILTLVLQSSSGKADTIGEVQCLFHNLSNLVSTQVENRISIPFKNRSLELLFQIGDGTTAKVYVAYNQGTLVAVKVPKMGGLVGSMIERDVLVSQYLQDKGLRVAKIIDYSPAENIAIKELVIGHTPHQLKKMLENGELSKEKYDATMNQLKTFIHNATDISYTREFQKFCTDRYLASMLDIRMDSDNLIFSNGEWVLIDP